MKNCAQCDFYQSVKVLGAFGVAIAVPVVVGVVGYFGIARVSDLADETAKMRLPSIENLLVVREAHTAVKAAERGLLLPGITGAQRQHELRQIRPPAPPWPRRPWKPTSRR